MGELDKVAGHAFISYVREDAAHVDGLQQALEAAAIPVWRDTVALWPGEDWRVMIRRAITDGALAVIACFSRASLARTRSYQNEELSLAIEQLRQRRPDQMWLFPVRFDECRIPDFDIGFGRQLTSIQSADLFGGNYRETTARLVTAIRRLLVHGTGTVMASHNRVAADPISLDVGPREAAREVARVLTALDDSCRHGGSLEESLERILKGAARDGGHGEEELRDFRTRIQVHGLDARVLIPGMAQHQEAVRRWLAPIRGAGGVEKNGDGASRTLLEAFARALSSAVLAGSFAEFSAGSRRYLGAALAGEDSIPLASFVRALTSQLMPLRSSSREVVLVRSDDVLGRDSGEDDDKSRRHYDIRLSSVAKQMCSLPPADPFIEGRARQVTEVAAAIRATLSQRGAATAFLSGQPGVGTSAVAIEAARELGAEFRGGVFYVDLHGLVAGARKDARTVVRIVSEALGLDLAAAADGDERMFAAFVSQLASRRILLVLDNARDAAHIGVLAQAPPSCGVIVTSRDQLQNFADPGLAFSVKPLARAESVQVLTRFVVGRAYQSQQLDQMAALCADVPLALRIMGARIASRPDIALDYHLQILAAESARLTYLEVGDRAVRTAIQLSYDNLDPSTRRVFRLIPAAPGSIVTGEDLGNCLDDAPVHQELVLNRLADQNLALQTVLWMPNGDLLARFALFDLIRLFAMERLTDEVPAEEVRVFRQRFVALLCGQLAEITDQADSAEISGELDPARFHAAEEIAEQENWLDLAEDLASSLYVLYRSRKELDSIVAINEIGIRIQLLRADYDRAAHSCLRNADNLLAMKASAHALAAARQARRIAEDYRLPVRAAEADFKISLLLGKDQQWAAALDAGDRAVTQIIALGREAAAIDAAINNCTFALEIRDPRAAVRWGGKAVELANRWGDKLQQASAALRRGRAEALAGNFIAAAALARRAQALDEEVEHWWNAGVASGDAALASEMVGDITVAAEQFRRTADYWRRSGDLPWQVAAMIDLSALHVRVGSMEEAQTVLDQAEDIASRSSASSRALIQQEILVRQAALKSFLQSTSHHGAHALDQLFPTRSDESGSATSINDAVLSDLRRYVAGRRANATLRKELLRRIGSSTWNPPDPKPFHLREKFEVKGAAGVLN